MQKSIRKILSLLLTAAMLMQPVFTAGALALEGAKDLDGHWAAAVIGKCHSYGIMNGDGDGYYRPGDSITRAEFMAMVNRAFNFTRTAGAAEFTDVPANAWYANDVKTASAMGYMDGVGGGKAAPEEDITREQAFTILARVFKLSGSETGKTRFSDDAQISSWARAAINGMAGAGYVQGSGGAVYPKAGITRGETAQVLVNVFGEIADTDVSGGTYQNLTIRKAGMTLTDTVINGDLFITDGVGAGDVTLNDVTIKGRALVTGGGPASVKVGQGSDLGQVVIESRFNTHLGIDKNAKVGRINLNSSSSVTHGDIFIEYDGETGKLTFGGKIDKITLNQNGYGTATVTIGGVTYDIVPHKTGGGVISAIELLPGCVAGEIVVDSAVEITGGGQIKSMTISAGGVTVGSGVNVDLKNITVAGGVNVSIGGKNYTGDGGPLGGGVIPPGGGGPAPVTGPSITTTSLAGGAYGDAYSDTLSAASDSAVTWSIDSGSLPAGLSLDTDTGEISGTPTAAGTASFTVKATDEDGSTTKALSITINKAALTFTADDKTVKTNTAHPTYTYTVSGWKFSDGSDSGAIITTGPTFTCTADLTRAGEFPITKATEAVLAGGNYTAAYADGTLTVTDKESVSITGVTAAGGTYDGSTHKGYSGAPVIAEGTVSFEYSYRGRNDTVYGPVATAPTNAGDYTVTISVAASDPDYTGSISLDFTINPKEITISAGTQSRTLIPFDSGDENYGTSATVEITAVGLIGDDTVAFGVDTNSYGLTGSTGETNILSLAYDGTPTGATTASVGLTLTGGNYTLSDSSTIDVTVYDGGATDRAIPVTADNIKEFNDYAASASGLSRHYKLTEDVTLAPPASGESNWTAIGSYTSSTDNSPFTGSFDGQGHTITGLTINGSLNYQGMFGYINKSTSTVKNLGLVNVSVSGNSTLGGVAGYLYSGTISYCYVTGRLSATGGNSNTGGVAGTNTGMVQYCCTNVTVTGSSALGGVAGYNYGTVQYCYAMGSVSGSSNNVGGIVGTHQVGAVRNCVALNASIKATAIANNRAGRVVGYHVMTSSPVLASNYAWNGMAVNGAFVTGAADGVNGADLTAANAKAASANWPFTFVESGDGWKWTNGKLPYLFDDDAESWPDYLTDPTAPGAPELDATTRTSVTLTAPVGANPLFTLEYGYSASASDMPGVWQDDPAFTGLTAGTTYYFFARYKGSGNIELPASGGLEVKTDDYGALSAADFSVSGDGTKTYNGAPQGAAVGYAGGITEAQAGAITVSYYNESYDSETPPTNAGTYNIMVKTAGGTDYSAITTAMTVGTLTIEKATLTVTAGEPSRALIPFDSEDENYGTTATAGIIVSGLIGDDTTDINLSDYGLTLSDNTGFSSDNDEKAVTITYNGTTAVSGVTVAPAIILSNANYTTSSTISVTVYDGQEPGARAIPVTEGNIAEFNTYVRADGLAKHYKLTGNVTLTEGSNNWTAIGSESRPFTGGFDGQGHTITGLTINNNSQRQGMFGYISGGTVKNLGLVNVSVTSSDAYVGGVTGYNAGTISNCFVTGRLTSNGGAYVGGVAGFNRTGGTVQYCYAAGTVSGNNHVGGLVGQNNYGTLKNCVALNQSVTASSSYAGRVTGYNASASGLSGNYAWNGMTVRGSLVTSTNANGTNGKDVSLFSLKTQSAWNAAGFNFTESGIWVWDESGTKMPSLKNQAAALPWPEYLVNILSAPTNVSLSEAGHVTWTNAAEATSYLVTLYKGDDSTGYTFPATDGASGVSVLDTMRAQGLGTYKATVIAKADGYEDSNAAASNTQEIKKLATPTGVNVSESGGVYTVSWTKVTGAAEYTVTLYKDGSVVRQNTVSANFDSFVYLSSDIAGAGTFTVTVTPRAAADSLYLDGEESAPVTVKTETGTVTVTTSAAGGGGTVTAAGTYNAGENVWLEARYTASTSGETTTGYVIGSWTVEYGTTIFTVENTGSGWAWNTPGGDDMLEGIHVTENGRFIGFTAPEDNGAEIKVTANFTEGTVIPWVLGGPALTNPNFITFPGDEVAAYQNNPVMIVDDDTTDDNKVCFVLPGSVVNFTFSDTSRGGETPIEYTCTKSGSDWSLTEALVSTYETLLMAINGTGQSGEALAKTVRLANDISAAGGNRAYALSGENAPSSRGLVIDGGGNTINFGLWFSSGENITVKNLTIDIMDAANLANVSEGTLKAAVLFEGGGASFENKLDNCLVWVHVSSLEGLNAESVIYIGSAAGATISNCRVIQNSPYGSYAVCTNNFAKTKITGTYMSGGYGLFINDLGGAYAGNTENIAGNFYFDCAVTEVLVLGIGTDAFPESTVLEDFEITETNVGTYFSDDAWTLITKLYGDTTSEEEPASFDIEFRDNVILNFLNDKWTCTQYTTSN